MVSNEQVKLQLIGIYSRYLENNKDKENRKKSYRMYLDYFSGTDTIFTKNVSSAIWSSFELSEGKLKEDEAKKILEELRKS